jgi:nucleotide-binding universal stress UspA family protein
MRKTRELALEQGSINTRANSLVPMDLGPPAMSRQLEQMAEQQRQVTSRLNDVNQSMADQQRDDLMGQLDELLRESEEIRSDREYLEQLCAQLDSEGISADCLLAGGDPAAEITAAAERERCDLIAMSTHGHRFLQDLVRGSVANEVRHISRVPVLLVRGSPQGGPTPASGTDRAESASQQAGPT